MPEPFAALIAVLRALADENRARIVLALRRQPLCVCQIVELTQLANSTVSEHLTILKTAGLLTSRKEGRWVYYRLAEQRTPVIAGIFGVAARDQRRDRQLRADHERLAEILRIDPAELCRRQKPKQGNGCAHAVANVR